MTLTELDDLSGAEVVSRLVHRHTPPWLARDWAQRRDEPEVREKILRVINDKGKG